MKKYALFIFLAVLAIAGGGYGAYATRYQTPVVAPVVTSETKTEQVIAPTSSELLRLVNEERAKNNVAPLVEDSRLDSSAQRKADDMVKYNYFGHISPNDGRHGYEYINDTSIRCKAISENLTDNTIRNDTEQAIRVWIMSAPHHLAMISGSYTLTGFGISGTKIVEHFCQP